MAEEKRVKLGVDVGELSNQVVQLNNLIEQNSQKAIQGQTAYNEVLRQSIELLQQQADLVGESGQNRIATPLETKGRDGELQNKLQNDKSIDNPLQSKSLDDKNDDFFKINEFLEGILDNTNKLWEKISALSNPIPVEVVNIPLLITSDSSKSGGIAGNTEAASTAGAADTEKKSEDNNVGVRVLGTTSNLMASGASDPNNIIASAVNMVPWVGVGLAAVARKMIGEAEQRVEAAAKFRGATGGNMDFMSLHSLGYKDAEAYQKEAQYYPSNVRLSFKDLQFEKGYGVGNGTMDSLLRSMRQDVVQEKFGTSSSELGVAYLTRLKNSEGNINPKEIRGYTEDYLKILIDLNQKQLETTGETNSLINSEVVASIANASEKFGDPTVLQRVVSSIKGGLTQASSPQTEALQYWAMSQANPEADIWKMELMKENPFSEESRGYFSNYLNSLLQTGNERDVKFNVKNAFGLTAHQTEQLLNGVNSAKIKAESKKETFNLTDYLEGSDLRGITSELSTLPLDAGRQISKEAGNATAENEVLLAKTADILANMGEPILELTSKAVNLTGEVVEKITNFFDNGLSGTLDKWWEDIKQDLKDMLPWNGEKIETNNNPINAINPGTNNIIINSTAPNQKVIYSNLSS